MKKNVMIMAAALLFTLGSAIVLNGQASQAAKTQKVRAVVKGSTLTISGKGALPYNLKVKKSQKAKVKKIVIKKGITSIPINAFRQYKNVTSAVVSSSVKTIGEDAFRCQKLKKLTIPGNFKIKSKKAYWITGKVDTVTFNTNLKLGRVAAFDADNLVVKKTDPKYKSMKGVIYSKDGKEIVRVPFQREKLAIEDGCEVFCLQSVLYSNQDAFGAREGGCQIRQITIPGSVRKIESQCHFAVNHKGILSIKPEQLYMEEILDRVQVNIQSRALDEQSLTELVHILKMDIDDLMRQLPERIFLVGNMYMTRDHVLLQYKGEGGVVNVPDGITKIGDYAFYDNQKITKLVLPEGVTEIGTASFSGCSAYRDGDSPDALEVIFPPTLKKMGNNAFYNNVIPKLVLPGTVNTYGEGVFASCQVEELVLPDTLKTVPENFMHDNQIKRLIIPDTVKKIQAGAFQGNPLVELQLGKGVTEIGENAFEGNRLKKLIVPASVKKIGQNAFSGNSMRDSCRFTFCGSSKGFSDHIVNHYTNTLVYTKSNKEKKTAACIQKDAYADKWNKKEVMFDLQWTPVENVSGYEIVAATNASFSRNKIKITVKPGKTKKKVAIQGKFSKEPRIYAKIRPYTKVKGKKIYGRWSVAI